VPLALLIASALVTGQARGAGEQHYQEEPAPADVDGYQNPVEEQFDEALPRRDGLLEGLLKGLPTIEDTDLSIKFRSYYLYGKLKSNQRREALTYGGWIRYRSNWFAERVRLGASFYTSQPVHAPSDRDGTLLLRPRQRQFAVMGESYLELNLGENHHLNVYRKVYDLPYLNQNDSRMVPNTFEGYTLQGRFESQAGYGKLDYVGGWLTRIKERDSDRFITMGESAGVGVKRGLALAGLLYSPAEDFSFGLYGGVVPDVGVSLYGMLDRIWTLSDDVKLRLVLQHTRQTSHGDHLITGRYFRTRLEAGYLAASYHNATVTLGFSTTGHERGIRGFFGGKPSPLSLMINDFDRAQEDAWLVGIAYDFSRLGLEGLSGFINYARGNDAHANDGTKVPDQEELDATVDYRFQEGLLKGLWLRMRGAFIRERDGGETQNELRVIINYDVNLL
jgi:hypothetical protein